MAIRRRRKKLTNLLSTLDRRVKSLELRPIDLLSASAAEAAAAFEDAIDVIVSDAAPDQYRPIQKAFFYPASVSGSSPRVEVFLESNLDVKATDRLEVSGVNGSGTIDLELSGDSLSVVSASSDPWDGDERKSYQYTPSEQESNLSNSVLYGTSVAAPEGSTQPIELLVKVQIESYEGSDTTIRINLAGPHKFKVGDAVYVELGIENPIVFGLDGLFRISNVDTNFIEYEIPTALAEPIATTSVVTVTRYVYAVGHKFVREGATWIDSSGSSDSVFVWRDLRWVSFSSYVGDDGVAPAPVTNLQGTSESRAVNGIQAGVARVTLTWTNPTANAEGGPLDDLFGFEVWHRYSDTDPWEKGDVVPGDDSEWTKDGFEVPKTVTFRVYALDSGGLKSEPTEVEVTTAAAAKQIKKPSPPQIEQYLGTPRFTWDGLQTDFTTPPSSAYEVEVHISTIDNFSLVDGSFPSGTYYGSFLAQPGGYLVVNAADLTDGTPYYVRFRLTDIHGNSEVSNQATFTAKVDKPVTFDLLDVGTLNGQLITGLGIQTGTNVNSGSGDQSGLILDTNGLRAYDNSGTTTFVLDANTGAVRLLGSIQINGYLNEEEISERIGAIDTTLDGNDLIDAINSATGGKITGTYIDEDSIVTPLLATDRFVSTDGGAVDASGTVINGSKITTGFISANRISGGTIDANKITVANLSADNITSGTLVGRTVIGRLQTRSSSGSPKRIILSESSNTIKFFAAGDSDSNHKGLVEASSTGVTLQSSSAASNLEVREAAMYFTLGSSLRSKMDMTSNVWLANGPRVSGGGVGVLRLTSTLAELKSPTYYSVSNPAQVYLFSGSSTGRVEIRLGRFRVNSLGGGGTVTAQLDSNGYLIRSTSDARIKKDVKDLNLGLDFIEKLRPVEFKFDRKLDGSDSNVTNYGLLAQDVRDVLKNDYQIDHSSNLLNKFENQGYTDKLPKDEELYSLDYPALVPMLINSIKELSDKIRDLEQKLDTKD